MRKIWGDIAWEDYLYWQGQDKKTLKKINRLLQDIDRNGYQCTGKPEPLSGDLAGYWSVLKFVLCFELRMDALRYGNADRIIGINNENKIFCVQRRKAFAVSV